MSTYLHNSFGTITIRVLMSVFNDIAQQGYLVFGIISHVLNILLCLRTCNVIHEKRQSTKQTKMIRHQSCHQKQNICLNLYQIIMKVSFPFQKNKTDLKVDSQISELSRYNVCYAITSKESQIKSYLKQSFIYLDEFYTA